MTDYKKMLNAHVKFESELWQSASLHETVESEVHAAFEWLKTVTVTDLVPVNVARRIYRESVLTFDINDDVAGQIGRIAAAAHTFVRESDAMVADLIPGDAYDDLVRAAISMPRVRAEITEQVTTNEVYSRLMSHVLYQGIKNYLQNENVIAKKVPGASTLMKMGQKTISTAAPKLEATIDRQLTSFVNANIQDTIRDSKVYLDRLLDDDLLIAVADEVWESNAKTKVSEFANLVPAKSVSSFVEAGRDVWNSLRETTFVAEFGEHLIDEFYAKNGKKKVAVLLSSAGITEKLATTVISDVAVSVVDSPAGRKHVEARIREHFEAFYSSYGG